MLNEQAQNWLRARKIDPAKAAALGLHSEGRGGGEAIAIPYFRGETLVTQKYRRIDLPKGEAGSFSQDPGKREKLVFNENALTQPNLTGPIVITEGEFDAVVAIQCGFHRAVSVPDGAPNDKVDPDDDGAKWTYVPGLIDKLRGQNDIILAVDGDQNGANLLDYLAARIGKARCKFVAYPDGCKDLNDVLVKHGPAGVARCLVAAKYIHVPGVMKMRDMPPAPELEVVRASLSDDFDRTIGICRGHLSVWTGVPSHGKSALVRAITVELARRRGWKAAVASFEDEVTLDYRRAIGSYLTGRPADAIEGDQWRKVDDWIDSNLTFIVEDEDVASMSLEWLIECMATCVLRHNADFLVIDPWNKIDHARPFGMNEHEYIGQALNELKRFARRFRVHVAIVAHPKKIDARDNEVRAPGGYDISGSANWFNMPDLGVTVFRNREDEQGGKTGCCDVMPWKIKRQPEMGTQRVVKLEFDPETKRYRDWYAQGMAAVK